MSKKRLLNEATVRRFMGLAGMESNLVSNTIKNMNENLYEEEPIEEPVEEPVDDAPPAEMGGEEGPEEPAVDAAEEPAAPAGEDTDVELTPEDIGKLKALKDAALEASDVVDMLDQAAGGEEPALDAAEEPALDAAEEPALDAAEEPAMDAAPDEEEEEVMEALSGINLELNEDELVQEVAKRVARRLIRAKKAQKQLDEALGRNKK